MTQISLTHQQINRLHEIAQQFPDVATICIEESRTTGIGANLYAKFSLFEREDTVVDITDYVSW